MLPTDNIRGTKAKVENHTKALEPAPHNYVGPTAATKGHLLPSAAADDEQKFHITKTSQRMLPRAASFQGTQSS